MNKPEWLLPGYGLDESDSDILVLRRDDGSFVAAFSSRGTTRDGILEAVKEDGATKDCREHEQEKPGHHRRGRWRIRKARARDW